MGGPPFTPPGAGAWVATLEGRFHREEIEKAAERKATVFMMLRINGEHVAQFTGFETSDAALTWAKAVRSLLLYQAAVHVGKNILGSTS